MDQAAAQPTLDVFRGRDPSQLTEGQVNVQVFNGSGVAGKARDARQALGAVGFAVGNANNASLSTETVIQYAPGSEAAADLLARHLSSAAVLVEDATLAKDQLALVVGTDFTTVMQTARPAETTTTTAPSTDSTATPADSAPSTSTTSTTVVGVTPGEAPPGVTC
jgi:hypothetical protein